MFLYFFYLNILVENQPRQEGQEVGRMKIQGLSHYFLFYLYIDDIFTINLKMCFPILLDNQKKYEKTKKILKYVYILFI